MTSSTIDDVFGIHVAPTMMPKQLCMVFDQVQQPRLLLGRESLWLQGFPIADPIVEVILNSEQEGFLNDLAGNMISTPVMLSLIMTSIASLSWRTSAPAHELSELSEIVARVEQDAAYESFALCAGTTPPPAPSPSPSGLRSGILKRYRKSNSS